MKNDRKYLLVVTALLCGRCQAFQSPTTASNRRRLSSSLANLPPPIIEDDGITANSIEHTETTPEIPLVSLESGYPEHLLQHDIARENIVERAVLPVVSTSLLITGNTVGAGMLVLPELAAGPGMGLSTVIFVVAFLINLLSGLLIAEVAIFQHASSGTDVPSSFQEFAERNLPTFGDDASDGSNLAVTTISGISVMVNALVLAFNMIKIGDFGSSLAANVVPAEILSLAWCLMCVTLVGSQSITALSTIASVLVFGLFASFGGLLIPGLAHMTTGFGDLLWHTPGTSSNILASASELAPIILMSLVYQNIVPTVTKMLDYDRAKTTMAIALGSFLPLAMYLVWSFCVVGGGIDTESGGLTEGPLMTLFTLTTIAGSSIGCVMSISEEFDTFVPDMLTMTKPTDKFAFPSVAGAVACALILSKLFANDLNGLLAMAGSFGSPLLYGVLPVIMAYSQRQQRATLEKLPSPPLPGNTPFELPNASIGLLGVASTGFVGNELWQSAQDVYHFVTL